MSSEFKNSLIVAFILSAVITLFTIFLGNTGSGFFRNSAIFVVGTIVGTPLAMLGRLVGILLDGMSNNSIFKYIGFLMGALVGVGLAVMLFSSDDDEIEMGFMYQCVRAGFSRQHCQCSFDNLADTYNKKELKTLLTEPNSQSVTNLVNSIVNCSVNEGKQSLQESKLIQAPQAIESPALQEKTNNLPKPKEPTAVQELPNDMSDSNSIESDWRDIQIMITNDTQTYISECMESYIQIAREFGGMSREEAIVGLRGSCEQEVSDLRRCMAMEPEESLKCYVGLFEGRDI